MCLSLWLVPRLANNQQITGLSPIARIQKIRSEINRSSTTVARQTYYDGLFAMALF